MSESLFDDASGESDDGEDPLLERDYAPITAEEAESESAAESRLVTRPVLALLAGTALCLLGLVVGVGALSGPSPTVEVLIVPTVGFVAVLFGIGWLADQFGGAGGGTEIPAVERTESVVPGADIDQTLASEQASRAPYGERTAIRRRLRRLVVAGLERAGHTSEQANRRVTEESWTDEPQAASFLTISGASTSRVGRLRRRIRARIRRALDEDSPFGRDARYTVDAAAALIGVSGREWTDPDDPDAIDTSLATGDRRTIDFETSVETTNRVRLVGGLVLIAVGLGIALQRPTLLLAGAVGTGVLAHRYAGGVPDPELHVERTVGSVVTDTGGSGIEFHSVREYRSGDPLRRIAWRRLAKGGTLATRQFSVERSTTVVIVVDTRAEAFVAAGPDAPTAVDRSVDAAGSLVRELLYSNDRVGLATIGPDRCWIEPRGGASQWPLVRNALTTHEAFVYPDGSERFLRLSTLHWLETRVPESAQLVFFSPLVDSGSRQIGRTLQARGYPVSVVSPRPTGTESPGRLVAHLERHLRLSRLRQRGLWTADWRMDEPLAAAFDRIKRRRSG